MSSTLPPYARSPTPSYASLPRPNEEDTVEYTPRFGRAERPFGHITKQLRDGVTVIFRDQDPETRVEPTYGSNGCVRGEIGVNKPQEVVGITVKLEARVNLSASTSGNTTQKIVEQRLTLWDESSPGQCPSVVAFALTLPGTYKDEGRVYRLPPSYEIVCLGTPVLVVRCTYKLSITITKSRKRFWGTGAKTYTIPIIFRPRTRPARPLLEDPCFLTTIKSNPYEWHQIQVTLAARKGAPIEPISCNFMIPSVQTFCVAHAIPFHIQLCGSVPSLREFYGQEGPRKRQGAVAIIRVFLVRQIYVEITGRETWRSITVGEGHVNPLPPVGLDEPSQGDVAVDWEGTVRCENDITSGTFSIGHLTVKDFIMLSVTPSNSSSLLPVQHGQPIRLVTDSWEEQGQVHPRDR